MSRELLKQALYALKYHSIQTRPIDLTDETIEALRQELAKPEQEPVAWAAKSIYGEYEGLSFEQQPRFDTPLYALEVTK